MTRTGWGRLVLAGLSWPELDCRNPPTTCEGAETPDSVSNFMHYGPCVRFGSSAFTAGQYRRMQWTLVGSRPGLIAQP
ncbi:MAG: hypothetical protein AAEJ53_17385 [Myxococcota bacterium]